MPAYYFLIMNRKPLVLRIRNKEHHGPFLANLRRIIGKKYNYAKAVQTWIALFMNEKLKIPYRVKDDWPDSVICSDAILSQYPGIFEILKKFPGLDYGKTGVFSLNDFLFLAEKEEFEVLKLPYPFLGISSEDSRYLTVARKLLKQESLFASIVNVSNLIQTGRVLGSIKKKKYSNAYRLVFAAAQIMKIARIKGIEAFHIVSFLWPRL